MTSRGNHSFKNKEEEQQQNHNDQQIDQGTSSFIDSSLQEEEEEQIVKRIPLYQEDFELTKKVEDSSIHIEKRWINSSKKIELPVKSEEIFLNGKELGAYSENEIIEIFSKIKDKISNAFHHSSDKDENHQQQHHNPNKELDFRYHKIDSGKKGHTSRFSLPLTSKHEDRSIIRNAQIDEKIIPLFGEQITINRKIVKMGEVVIKKYQITENQEIKVELRKEQISTKYPKSCDVEDI